jgi:hypothetical protein
MKKLLSLFAITICLAILFYPETTIGKLNGSPGGKTGSPTDNASCTNCHNAGAGTGATITTNIPATGYIAGNVYTITANINQSGVNTFGFEITAEEANFGSSKTGTFFVTNSTETKLVNSNTAITHRSAGTSGANSKSWSMDWEAPSSGTGAITFYGAYIGANGNGNNSGDTYHSATLTFNEEMPIPGCTDLNATNYNPAANVDDGSCTYPMTYVPDDNFENYLEANGMGDGIALNDSVFTVNINTVTNLNVFNLNIADLTGIEEFTALEYLQCAFNQLTSLNVSSNSALDYLDCHENQLTSLDVSGANSLNTLLCYNNQLTSLDVSSNTSLTEFNCESNQLTSLDVTSNTALIDLTCYFNNLTSLDIGINPALNVLLCASNLLTSLDVSGANALYHISCSYNQLTSLDVRNGNNTNMVTFNSTNNPNLTCINVDDVSYSTTNWTNDIDAWSSFSLNCIISGCTDPLACNYDPLANSDDSSCVYLDIIAIATDVSCFGMFDGSIAATAAGGIFPLQYSLGAGLSQTSGTFLSLSAGSYYIDVTDANNCTSNQMVIITEPAPLSVSADSTNETAALNDGSATAIISGGTAGYTYLWDDPLAQITSTATNLAPGLYTVIITDANGCVISDATSVNAYTPTGIINIKNTSKRLLKVTDILGKETPYKRNRTLFYIYNDGTVEKKIIIE